MTNRKEVVIVDAIRTPFDKFGGVMRDVPSIELAAFIMREIVRRNNLKSDSIDEVYHGTCMPAEVALSLNVPARQATLKAGLDPKTLSLSIDRACCSSMTAIQMACRAIWSGEADTVLATGADNMSRVPYLVDGARFGKRMGHIVMDDELFGLEYKTWNPVAKDAGEVALEENVLREDQDKWALRSQQMYQLAKQADKFRDEIVPYTVVGPKGDVEVTEDVSPRGDTTLEKLAKLKTVYGSPTCTAGNAPGLNTGASGILLMSREKAEAMGLKPLAVILDACSANGEAKNIARVPAAAISRILERNGKTIEDMSRIEINEAFAVMPLVSTKILSNGDNERWHKLQEITNVNGGAIAIGHPVGATGARLVMTLMYELRRIGGGCGVAALCGGLAQGDAVLIQVL